MERYCRCVASACLLVCALAACGCRPKPATEAAAPPQIVTVSLPVVREFHNYVDFTGRTEAVETVEIRARVTGYLDKISFKEGDDVKKGDLLFQIDPRPFKAQYDQTLAEIKVREANLQDQRVQLARAKSLLAQNAIAQADFDKAVAAFGEAEASVTAAQAAAEVARLNLEFTTIAAPVAGRASRAMLTVGNLINADASQLTSVVSQDPMYVYFDLDEHTMLQITRSVSAAQESRFKAHKTPVRMGVADEEGFPHEGVLDFADNQVDSSTGTIVVRGVFANPASPSGVRLLRPGMFVRVRLALGDPHPAPLVAERALGSDQGKKYLLVVDKQNVVQYRRVELGPLQDDGLRAVLSGLQPDERVIVSGLQLVRPKMTVQTEEAPMPALPAAEPAASSPRS